MEGFMVWCSPRKAREIGATHYAWFLGLVPGFFNPQTSLWVSRSDLLCPIEDILSFIWVNTQQMLGHEPSILFSIGREIPEPPA